MIHLSTEKDDRRIRDSTRGVSGSKGRAAKHVTSADNQEGRRSAENHSLHFSILAEILWADSRSQARPDIYLRA